MASWKDLELNETGWWSHWADVRWTGEVSYVMLSSDFDEYFFNRAGFIDCGVGPDAVAKIEEKFGAAGKPPCFSIQSGCKELVAMLNSRGYTPFDEMSVMQMDKPRFRQAAGLRVLQSPEFETAEWAAAYALAFYGDLSFQEPVKGIVGRLAGDSSVTLLAGEKDGKTLGILAAFRTSGLLGVYCVGTLRERRRAGVAGALLLEVARIASTEGRLLVLQTVVSDGVEDFYSRGGFRRLHLKHLMRRETAVSERSEGATPP